MRAFIVLLLAATGSCGGQSTPVDGDGDGDADTDADTDVGADADVGVDADAGERDAEGSPYCECPTSSPLPERPTWMFHPCVPPLLYGCEAQTCTPGGDDCPEGTTCDEWGAAACCICSAVVPACVPSDQTMGPLPEYLALRPVYAPAGAEHELEVTGFPFYVGALFYLARVGGSEELMEIGGGDTCTLGFRAPAHAAGTAPVWVSQYGGAEPWVLAGFVDYGADVATCVQPGLHCDDEATRPCCESPDVPMSCRNGRCLRD